MIARPVKPPFAYGINRGNPITSGLVGAWFFTEGFGNRVFDASGYENHGTLLGWAANTAFSGGPHGFVLDCNDGNAAGADLRLDLGSGSSLDNLAPFTWMVQVYARTTGESQGRIFAKNAKNLLVAASTQLRCTVNRSSTNADTTCNGFALNTWYTVAVKYTAADGIRIYLGTLTGPLNEAGYASRTVGSGSETSDAADTLFMGNRSALDRTFDGYFNYGLVWNRALDLEEMRRIHENPFSLIASSRPAIWTTSVEAEGGIAGTSDGAATVSGTLKGWGRVDGSASGLATVSGSLESPGNIAGTSDGVATVSGTLKGTGRIVAVFYADSTCSGNLEGYARCDGSASGSATVSGALQARTGMSGTANGAATTSGTLKGKAALEGSAAGQATVTGRMASDFIAGVVAGIATASGHLIGRAGIDGSASGLATVLAELVGTAEMAGSASGQATVAGILAGLAAMEGSAPGIASASASLSAQGVVLQYIATIVFGTRSVEDEFNPTFLSR